MRYFAAVLLIPFAIAASAFAVQIDGKKPKEAPKTLDGLEFKVIDISGNSRFNDKGFIRLEIKNLTDSLVVVDLNNFTAVDIEEHIVKVQPKQMLRNDGMEMVSDRVFEPIRKVKAGKTLKETVPFIGPLVTIKEKPVKLYWGNILLFEIYD